MLGSHKHVMFNIVGIAETTLSPWTTVHKSEVCAIYVAMCV